MNADAERNRGAQVVRVAQRAVVLTCVAAALMALGGCRRGDKARREPPPVPVVVGTVVRKAVPVSMRAVGSVVPIATVAVKARIGGELTKVHFREGQTVRAGDVLFTIDPRSYQAALRQAQAQLARNQALAKKAEADVARYAELVAKDFVTKEQYDGIVANGGSLLAAVQADQANVDNAKLQLAYCTITAPIAGRIGELSVKQGNLIQANGERPLVTINQVRPIDVSFTVPAQLLPELVKRRGEQLKVSVTLPDEKGAEDGVLTFVDNGVDPATSTVRLRATFANAAERLWAGQFVDVTLRLSEEADRVVAPATAVQAGQQGDYVFVVKPDQKVELRVVKVSRRDEHAAVISSGLEGGETVVTDGHIRLKPGDRVEAKGNLTQGGEAR
jgi:membrane fusion protein, multidrug efflux system